MGDLVDRGPDSPAVVELVRRFVEAGRAQCILGNHEMNLLRDDKKQGNHWFIVPGKEDGYESKFVDVAEKKGIVDFLLKLPLALANDKLRVVHACWHHQSIAELEKMDGRIDSLSAFNQYDARSHAVERPQNMTEDELDRILKDRDNTPELLVEQAEYDVAHQMNNPLRVLTSGVEVIAKKPFWAGGKWRMVSRQKWWENYVDTVPVVVGHYWRRFNELPSGLSEKDGPDLFEGIEPHHWMGKKKNIYCVDFSVGLRHKANAENSPESMGRLAALRWPEKLVMYDDGEWAELSPGTGSQDIHGKSIVHR